MGHVHGRRNDCGTEHQILSLYCQCRGIPESWSQAPLHWLMLLWAWQLRRLKARTAFDPLYLLWASSADKACIEQHVESWFCCETCQPTRPTAGQLMESCPQPQQLTKLSVGAVHATLALLLPHQLWGCQQVVHPWLGSLQLMGLLAIREHLATHLNDVIIKMSHKCIVLFFLILWYHSFIEHTVGSQHNAWLTGESHLKCNV